MGRTPGSDNPLCLGTNLLQGQLHEDGGDANLLFETGCQPFGRK
jgi:hypothetical protein